MHIVYCDLRFVQGTLALLAQIYINDKVFDAINASTMTFLSGLVLQNEVH